MRLFVKKGSLELPVLVGHAQQYVETEDFICAMMKHAKPCGGIKNMFVEFENTKILVSHVTEVRILAQMAAAYYNATLQQNLAYQKDCHGQPYTAQEASYKTVLQKRPLECIETAEAHALENCKDIGEQRPRQGRKQKEEGVEWDEELLGDRRVYDSTYEINENLVPWLMNPDKWQDKYGFY